MLLVTVESHWVPKGAEKNARKQFVWHYLTNLSLVDFMIYYGNFRLKQSEKYGDQEVWWNINSSQEVGDVSKEQAAALLGNKTLALRMLIKDKKSGKMKIVDSLSGK